MMVKTIQQGDLEYLVAENIGTAHCFTTRFGGVSKGHLAAMNIGIHRGDKPENVLKNYEILGNTLGFSPKKAVLTTQTHTDIVRTVGESEHGAGLFAPELPPCDGLITCTPGTALVVFTADCTPILLHDPVTGAVGAVHAGWRGTAAAIGAKAVQAMCREFGCKAENIRAAIGPNIAGCCFETDKDVPEAMVAQYGAAAEKYIRAVGNKFFVDLKEINALGLASVGVENIAISQLCTACDGDRFWSHRRVGGNRGSQGAIIVCKE
ncbi:MAG: peptidoglycan editing factor PgeF [Oscillospiraceae bacterium]|nr:peptidoglycan editing factor PgeF [Oscillospiraceae bacterium]